MRAGLMAVVLAVLLMAASLPGWAQAVRAPPPVQWSVDVSEDGVTVRVVCDGFALRLTM